jgi:hypothetical protein
MASHYTREADRVRLAKEAQAREREANIYSRTFGSGSGRGAKDQSKQ